MKHKICFYLLLILTLLGFFISFYLTYVNFSQKPYVCPTNNDCDKVLSSKYSQIFNIPLSLFGAIYFLMVLFFLRFQQEKLIKISLFFGFLVGLILIYLQVFVLKAICFYCFIVDSILVISPLILVFDKIKLKHNFK